MKHLSIGYYTLMDITLTIILVPSQVDETLLMSFSDLTWLVVAYWHQYIIGSRNGLLPDSTKPLPEPMLRSNNTQLRAISQEILKISLDKSLKIINHRLKLHLPEAKGLTIGHQDGTSKDVL